jgi:hypothetical protein
VTDADVLGYHGERTVPEVAGDGGTVESTGHAHTVHEE